MRWIDKLLGEIPVMPPRRNSLRNAELVDDGHGMLMLNPRVQVIRIRQARSKPTSIEVATPRAVESARRISAAQGIRLFSTVFFTRNFKEVYGKTKIAIATAVDTKRLLHRVARAGNRVSARVRTR